MEYKLVNSFETSKDFPIGCRVIFSALIVLCSFAPLPIVGKLGLPSYLSTNAIVLLIIGLMIQAITRRFRYGISSLVRNHFIITLLLALMSIGSSIVLQSSNMSISGESPMGTCLITLCWLIFHFASVVYLSNSFSSIRLSDLDTTFEIMSGIVLVFGILEIGMVFRIPGARNVFELVNVGGWIQQPLVGQNSRIAGVCSEPAHMGTVLSMFCLPYHISKIDDKNSLWHRICIAVLLVLACFTFASTVYITVSFLLLMIAGYKVLFGRINRYDIVAVCIVGSLICVFLLFVWLPHSVVLRDSELVESIRNTLVKPTNRANQSTAYRLSVIINDYRVFLRYPLFGVGEGNQGFFYAENVPSWIVSSGTTEAARVISGSRGVINGGPFLPSLISGYGLVGLIAYLSWFAGCVRYANHYSRSMGTYYKMFIYSLIGSIPLMITSIGFSGFPAALFIVLTLPFVSERQEVTGERAVVLGSSREQEVSVNV